MVIVFETSSGKRMPEMAPRSYAEEIVSAGWVELPEAFRQALPAVAPRLAEHEVAGPGKASPFADPDFIARVYRAQG